MNIEEIRKGAPEGASHYTDHDGDIVYFQRTNNIIYWDDEYKKWDEPYFEIGELKPL